MSKNPSGSDILSSILQGLWLDNSDSGYQRLSEILDINFGVIITVDQMRILGKQKPVHPVLEVMSKWPWIYAADEECQRFYKTLRVAIQQAGFHIREDK